MTEYTGFNWPVGDPADYFDVAALNAALANPDDHSHGVVVICEGERCAESYYHGWRAGLPNNIKSASKSIMSLLYGIAVDQGILAGGDQQAIPLAAQFPAPYNAQIPAELTAYHMLTMTAGLRDSAQSADNEARFIAILQALL